MNDHPLIRAIQDAIDTHGMPDDIAVVSFGSHWRSDVPAFTIWAAADGNDMASATGSHRDLATACALAVAKHEQNRRRVAEQAAARAKGGGA